MSTSLLYVLSTHRPGDGAVVGRHRVYVGPPPAITSPAAGEIEPAVFPPLVEPSDIHVFRPPMKKGKAK